MAIGTALAIGMGVAAAANTGAQIYGAKQAGKASKQAAAAQTKAADQNGRIVDEMLMPYANAGRAAASTLGRLTAAPPGSRFAAPDPTMGPPPAQNTGQRPMDLGKRGTLGGFVKTAQALQGGADPREVMAQRRGTIGGLKPPAPGGGGGMVAMRSPDGEVREVPAEAAEHYMRLGATRVQ